MYASRQETQSVGASLVQYAQPGAHASHVSTTVTLPLLTGTTLVTRTDVGGLAVELTVLLGAVVVGRALIDDVKLSVCADDVAECVVLLLAAAVLLVTAAVLLLTAAVLLLTAVVVGVVTSLTTAAVGVALCVAA